MNGCAAIPHARHARFEPPRSKSLRSAEDAPLVTQQKTTAVTASRYCCSTTDPAGADRGRLIGEALPQADAIVADLQTRSGAVDGSSSDRRIAEQPQCGGDRGSAFQWRRLHESTPPRWRLRVI